MNSLNRTDTSKNKLGSYLIRDKLMLINKKIVRKWDGKTKLPGESIEFDEGLIDLEGLVALSRRVTYLAMETPKPDFYADAWLKMSLNDSETPPDKMPCKEDVTEFKSSLPPTLLVKLTERKDAEKLFIRLFQAKNIFEPLILIESGLIRVKNSISYKSSDYISEKDELVKMFKRDLSSYKTTLEKLNMFDHLIKYIQSLPFSCETKGINKHSIKNSKKYNGISRVNYAFMMMVITDIPDEIKGLASFFCKYYLKLHKKEKVTKVSIHTLSNIIYKLMIEHATEKTPKGSAYCYGLVAQILTAFSPKKENGEPCYSIDGRGVQFALTGK